MTLDASATAHLMSVLTDLYSDPELAVIREYSTNALDAHKVAKVTRPIEVTTPTPLAPFFRVRDYGEGLSADDIRNVFSRYGTSTKRDSNDVVGMLGLGCKSALTYADQFTLVATKNGRTVQVLVSRDEDGAGSMTIVSDEATDNPSGVEVVVPTKRGDAFGTKSAAFFRYWSAGTVLVNGEAPARIGDNEGLWLTPSLLLTKETGEDIVVMGNVPYPALDSEGFSPPWRGSYYDRRHLVAFVDIGEVSFTPSREALQGTKGTKATLARVRAEAVAALEESCRRQVAGASSATEAIRLARESRAFGAKSPLTFQGRTVPEALDRTPKDSSGQRVRHADPTNTLDSFLIRSGRTRRVNGERTFTLALDGEKRYYFTGYDSRELTPTKREKIAAYFADKGYDATRVQVFAKSYSATERYWLDGATFVNWGDVDAVKLARPTRADGTTRPRGSYDVMTDGVRATVDADAIDASKPIYYVHGNKWSLHHIDAVSSGIISATGCTFVALPANRVGKFRRDFPTAVEVGEAAKTVATAWLKRQDPATLEAYTFQRNGAGARMLREMDPARVADPKLRAAIDAAKRDTSALAKGHGVYGRILPYGTFDAPTKHADALAPYPLAANVHGKLAREHFYLYTDAVYAASLNDSPDNPSGDDAASSGGKG